MRLTHLLCLLALGAAAGLSACGGTAPTQPAASDATPVAATSSTTPPIRIGIALGGGAAKGFAHIGVIKMLEANGFAPAVVSGTSAGSVVGALYASGMNAFEMQEKAVALDEAKIRDLQLSSGGLVLGQKLEDYVNEQVRRKPLEQMAKPFVVVATRLEDGERTVFARGNTGQAVRASSSVPSMSPGVWPRALLEMSTAITMSAPSCRPSMPKPNARPSKKRQKPSNRPAWSSAAACKSWSIWPAWAPPARLPSKPSDENRRRLPPPTSTVQTTPRQCKRGAKNCGRRQKAAAHPKPSLHG